MDQNLKGWGVGGFAIGGYECKCGSCGEHFLGDKRSSCCLKCAVDAVVNARPNRQKQVADWCVRCFGDDHASSLPQRGIRLAEEAIEAAQAAGCERAMVHQLVDYIFDRPPGELGQELGGVGVTVLALANAANLSADDCEAKEVLRILSKPAVYFTQRNAEKNDAGFAVTGGYPVEEA